MHIRKPRAPFAPVIVAILLAWSFASLSAQAQTGPDGKLIVQITIDQFRADYLSRFGPAFSGGLKRLMDQGLIDPRGTVDHAITNSYPGHLSLSTGMYPASHGFSANEWWVFKDDQWTWVDGGADEATQMVGYADRTSYSPRNARATTLGDWVKMSNPEARSISLAASEIAVAYGGRSSDGVYWFDSETGQFVTSSYYRDDYPDWIGRFNAEIMPTYRIDQWTSAVPAQFRALARPDNEAYENGGRDIAFPHRFEDVFDPEAERSREEQYRAWFGETPMRDVALLELAALAVKAEKLGQGGTVDYLSITLSATDSVGHNFGGRSQEALDALYRVDQALGRFLDALDEAVGADGYVIALSGDHGAPDVIEYMQAEEGVGRRLAVAEIDAVLDQVDALGAAFAGSEAELTEAIEQLLEDQPFVADAITEAEIYGLKPSSSPYLRLFRNSWVAGRIPDFPLWTSKPNRVHHPARYGIFALFREYTYFEFGTSVHGSPYAYDREVPVIFFGAGIKRGHLEGARTIDVAPTLAALAGLSVPDNVDGRPLCAARKALGASC